MLKLAAKRPLEQWGASPSQCSPHRCATALVHLDSSPASSAAAAAKRMRTDSPGSHFGGAFAQATPGDAEAAAMSDAGAAAPGTGSAVALARKRTRRLDGTPTSHLFAAGASGSGPLFFPPHAGVGSASAPTASPGGSGGGAAAAAASVAAAAAATAPGSLAPAGEATSPAALGAGAGEGRLFSVAELRQVVKHALEVREVQLRGEYDKVLQARLQEQFESFSRYHEDYVSRQLKQSDFSYMS